ncbi:MAG: imelysin family protein [Flavobacteriales bacterium]|nr:imelysin family protein [Flavobacteriales bacterium]
MRYSYLLLLLAFALASCDNNDPEEDPMVDTRYSAQLPQLVNNYITPELDATVNEVEALRASAEAFDLALDPASLDAFQAQLKEVRLQWQRISFLWFGPGDEQNTVREVNTFPADVMAVSAHADEGSIGGEGLDEKGFCAIGWMIHHVDDQGILDFYNDENYGASRRAHLLHLVNEVESAIGNLNQAWDNGFDNTFSTATGSSVGSGMSLYHNGLTRDYENLKREKIALPLGLLTLDIPLPDKVEAFYSGYSVELAIAHLTSTRDALTANDTGGILALIDELGAFHSPSNQDLSDAILEQLDEAKAALELVPDPLSGTIESDPAIVQTAYDELQAAVVLLKIDLTSALDVSITYTDTDGD